MDKQSVIRVSFGTIAATVVASFLIFNSLAIAQDCGQPPDQIAVKFLQDFQRAANPETLRGIYDRYISRARRFTFEEFAQLKREVGARFETKSEKNFRAPEVVRTDTFRDGNVRGTEVTLVALYPNGRVTEITRLVCEGNSWKVFAFEFQP